MSISAHIAERGRAVHGHILRAAACTSGTVGGMLRRGSVIAVLLSIAFVTDGCISRIISISAPSEVSLEEEFVVAIDGTVSGHGGGLVALVLQVPDAFELVDASWIGSHAKRPLRRNVRIEARFVADSGHTVLALADSIPWSRTSTDDIRAFIRFRATALGTHTLSVATGAVLESGSQLIWKTTDPEDLRDFGTLDDPRRTATITVIEGERNGGAAIVFSGSREYLALPDTGIFRFDLMTPFTIETWFQTVGRDAAILSTRMDDLTGPFPLELGIDAFGAVVLSSSGGDSVVTATHRGFHADGRWHHLALTYTPDPRMFEVYVDGLFVSRLTAPPGAGAVRWGPTVLGARSSRRRFFAGALDEFRVWTGTRTQEQIAYYRTLALTGYEDGLAVLYSFDAGEEGRIPNASPVDGYHAIPFNRPKLVPSGAPLKVELLSFSVTREGDEVVMTWESFDESQVRSYEIEKRSESTRYARLFHVEALRTAEKRQSYRFTDVWSGKTIAYYRLRRVSTDGSMVFSDEVPIGSDLVLNFTLGDNQPNPFSERTVIPFTLTERAHVSLVVYDLMGRQVAELVSERLAAGDHQAVFEGGELPAGMYFYKMRTAAGAVTKKMYLSR